MCVAKLFVFVFVCVTLLSIGVESCTLFGVSSCSVYCELTVLGMGAIATLF